MQGRGLTRSWKGWMDQGSHCRRACGVLRMFKLNYSFRSSTLEAWRKKRKLLNRYYNQTSNTLSLLSLALLLIYISRL